VKYLSTLEKFLEPFSSHRLQVISDALPGLINGVKMVYTVSRYYNTTERMTSLFMKITNLVSCVSLFTCPAS
jgi:dynein heavy chain, axonemal